MSLLISTAMKRGSTTPRQTLQSILFIVLSPRQLHLKPGTVFMHFPVAVMLQ